MSNIEKIRQKIEGLMKETEDSQFDKGERYGLKTVLEFIDSLSEEKPSEDFPTSDEEVAKFLATHPKVEVPEKYKTPNWLFDKQPSDDLEEAVFKEWGTTKGEYLAKSMDKVHLEMEIATYLQDWEDDDEIGLHLSTDNGSIPIELEDIRDLARHFAEWQKEQMMKDAVEGYVTLTLTGVLTVAATIKEGDNIGIGDKVKIVIVKQDE